MTVITLNRGGGGLGVVMGHLYVLTLKYLYPVYTTLIPKRPGLLWPRRKQQPEPGVL